MSRRITLSRSRGRIEAPLEHDWEVFQRGEDRRQQQRERTTAGSVMSRGQIGGAKSDWSHTELNQESLKAFAKAREWTGSAAWPTSKKPRGSAMKFLEEQGVTEADYITAQVAAGVNPWKGSAAQYQEFERQRDEREGEGRVTPPSSPASEAATTEPATPEIAPAEQQTPARGYLGSALNIGTAGIQFLIGAAPPEQVAQARSEVEQVVLENIDTFTSESGLGDDEDEDIAALTEAANSLRAAISQTSDPDERTILAAVAVEGLSRVAQDAEIPIAEEIGQIHQSLNSSISSLPFHSPLRQSFAETPIRPESLV